MLGLRRLLFLVVVLVAWPASAQEPPASVSVPISFSAIKPGAFLGAPVEIRISKDSSPGQAIQQVAAFTQPKDGDAPLAQGKIVPALPQQEMLHPIWSSLPPLSVIGEPSDTAVSFGWWYASNRGSLVKTGEYQDPFSSPFWEINGLYSDGYRTLGIYGNQTDNESNQGSIHFFSPRGFVDVDFQRFIHRLDHIPVTNFLPDNAANAKLPSNSYIVAKDLNVGEDYAIRVEELRASVGERFNDNLRLKVDVWQMRKFGERQENATAHCFVASAAKGSTSGCHVLSQSQHIDWLTVEVTPRLEAKLGPITIEYSRPMRQFTQDDQLVFRDYNNGSISKISSSGGMIWGTYPYAIVPESLTQIDQLKASIDLGPTRQFYGFGYVGNTHNQDRDVNRSFNGYDLRYTDWTIARTTVTFYGKSFNQTGSRPTDFLPDELQFLTPAKAEANIRTPVEYHRDTGGIKGNWRPDIGVGLFNDLIVTAGYEYDHLNRQNAVWTTPGAPIIFRQADTATQTLFAGVRKPWSCNVDTFVRYKVLFVDDPLYGFRELSNVINTRLPQQQHIVEFGGGWYPQSNFSIMVEQDIEVGQTNNDRSDVSTGNVVDFREQSYATTVTMCYAPTTKLSLIASASFYSNWINQNLFLGDDYTEPGQPPAGKLPLVTQPAFYSGTSELFNFHLNYKLSEKVRLHGGYQFVRGNNQFNMLASPSFSFSPGTPIPTYVDLPQYSAVLVETHKITAGITWRPRPLLTVYLNYNFFDYNDKTNSYNSGTAHMVMGGLSRIW